MEITATATTSDSAVSQRNTKLSHIITRDLDAAGPIVDFILGSPLKGLA